MKCGKSSLLCALLTVVAGCSSDENKPVDWSMGRGGEGCRDWQKTFCEYALRCGGMGLEPCAAQQQTVTCKSEDVAASCATTMSTSSCGAIPAGCNTTDIADSTWAAQACNDLLTAACTHDAGCGTSTDVATCVSNLQTTVHCDRAIGVKLNYEGCITRIEDAACTVPPPADCNQLIYTTSS